MTCKFKIVFLLLFGTFLLQCNKDDSEEIVDPVVEDEKTGTITDPFYAVLNENSSLEDYWDLYVKDAIRSGKPDPR